MFCFVFKLSSVFNFSKCHYPLLTMVLGKKEEVKETCELLTLILNNYIRAY